MAFIIIRFGDRNFCSETKKIGRKNPPICMSAYISLSKVYVSSLSLTIPEISSKAA